MSDRVFVLKGAASAPEAVQLERVTRRMEADARLFLRHRPPISETLVPKPAAHTAAPDGQSVLVDYAVDQPLVDFETLGLAQMPLPLALDRAATRHTTNCG